MNKTAYLEKDYSDMIDLPRPVSKKHPPLPVESRAAQFSPFAALTGYDALIEEGARLTQEEILLGEEAIEELNAGLRRLPELIARGGTVRLEYFEKDPYKAGGAYLEYTGRLVKYDGLAGWLKTAEGDCIFFEQIKRMEITGKERGLS